MCGVMVVVVPLRGDHLHHHPSGAVVKVKNRGLHFHHYSSGWKLPSAPPTNLLGIAGNRKAFGSQLYLERENLDGDRRPTVLRIRREFWEKTAFWELCVVWS